MAVHDVTIFVDVEMKTNISFWNALKLRLAGGKAVEKLIETRIKSECDFSKGAVGRPSAAAVPDNE